MFSKKLKPTILEETRDKNGRYVLLNVTLNDENYILFNQYSPTKDKHNEQLKHFEPIQALYADAHNKNIILSGNFNLCMNPDIDKSGGRKEKPWTCAMQLKDLKDMLKSMTMSIFGAYETPTA